MASGVATATLTQAWFPPLVPVWSWPTWALSAVVFLYVVMPWLMKVLARLSRPQSIGLLVAMPFISLAPTAVFLLFFPDGAEGSQNWQGQRYAVFRNYHSEWHDQGWWHSHYHNNIVFVFGAPYFFNAGYWYPAWGYYPNAYYAWDGPIYAYNHLPPDQVIANVQAALQEQGYYHGEVDGLIGPLTRAAIADYQRDHGLYETAAIDQPTLESLGMA